MINADGSGETNISNNPATDCVPSGSVSGSIVFGSTRDDSNIELYTMNPDGSGVTRITNNMVFDYNPNWSPDAARIVFIGTCGQRRLGHAGGRECTDAADRYPEPFRVLPGMVNTGRQDRLRRS